MPEVIGWWNDEEVVGEPLPPPDPFEFTALGRQMQRIEHEQRLTQLVTDVERWKARRRELVKEINALRSKRQREI